MAFSDSGVAVVVNHDNLEHNVYLKEIWSQSFVPFGTHPLHWIEHNEFDEEVEEEDAFLCHNLDLAENLENFKRYNFKTLLTDHLKPLASRFVFNLTWVSCIVRWG